MPHTLERVQQILDWLKVRDVPPVTLLVVPGREWSQGHIDTLRHFAQIGHPLAAHGWLHETKPRKLYHRIHAALISRNVAEHLDLNSRGVLELLIRSKNWFNEQNLTPPDFYVPPAWALGPIKKSELIQAPYKKIETTRGLIRIKEKCTSFEPLPLTGYEADTWLRESFLRWWNTSQEKSAARKNKPLRISIHPDDLHLRVADQLEAQIEKVSEFLAYN